MRNCIRDIIISAVAVLVIGAIAGESPVSAAELNNTSPRITIPLVEKGPSLKGDLSSPEWKKAVHVGDFIKQGEKAAAAVQTKVYALYDPENLYVAFVCDEPDTDKLVADLGALWNDDCVELCLDPANGTSLMYHWIVNSTGGTWNGMHSVIGTDQDFDTNIQVETSVEKKRWICEMKVPFKDLGTKPVAGEVWGVNFCRERKVKRENSSWSFAAKSFGTAGKLGEAVFSATADTPVKVNVLSRGGGNANFNKKGRNLFHVNIDNTDKTSAKVKLLVESKGRIIASKQSKVKAGQSKKLSVLYNVSSSKKAPQLRFSVTVNGKQQYSNVLKVPLDIGKKIKKIKEKARLWVVEVNLRDGKMYCVVRAVVTNASAVAGKAVVRLEKIENNKRIVVSSAEIQLQGSESKEVVLDSPVELVLVEGSKSLLQPENTLRVVVAVGGKGSRQESISVFVRPVQISVINQAKPELKCISAFSKNGAGNKDGKLLITIENAKGDGKILASREYQLTGGEIKVDFQADKLPTGRLLARAWVKDAEGKTVFAQDVIFAHLSKEPERLNNLVCQLEKGKLKLKKNRTREIVFENPRDGWVWMKLVTVLNGEGEITINKGGCEWFKFSATGEKETMRWVKDGMHRLTVSAAVKGKIDYEIRSVPELVLSKYDSSPIQRRRSSYRGMKFGPYDDKYLKSNGLLKNINMMEIGRINDRNRKFAKEWSKNGKKWFRNINPPFKYGDKVKENFTAEDVFNDWSESEYVTNGLNLLNGYFIDEFIGRASNNHKLKWWAGGMRLMLADKRFKHMTIYPFLTPRGAARSTDFFKFVVELYELGTRLGFEWYPGEEPTPEQFGKVCQKFRNAVAGSETKIPGLIKHSQFVFSMGNMPVFPMCDVYPDVDYKVFLDLQVNMMANDPLFKDLGGMKWYLSAYTDDETMRWCSALSRHYAIEGRRDKLSDRYGFKYNLTHIVNGDFDKGDNGLEGWKTKPAREGNMAVKRMMISDFGWRMQSRKVAYERRGKNIGNNVLWMKRSLAGPNLASQTIHGLKPGRLYSLKMISGDYGDLMAGKSVITKHVLRAIVENVEIIPSESFVGAWSSSGYKVERFNNKDPYWWNYHYMVFRAKGNQAKLTISDWADEKNPGGPEGQEQICNFIQIQPYFEKVEKINF